MRVIVGFVDAVLDQRPDVEASEIFTKPVAVIPLIGGKREQLARIAPGELQTHFGVTALSGSCAVYIEDRLRLCIDELRRFDSLNAVVRAVAIRSSLILPVIYSDKSRYSKGIVDSSSIRSHSEALR
jgi:hypothetical protein